jgi:hypothetical protein
VYSNIDRIEGGINPIIKTFGATSPGISILSIRTIIPKNDTSSVNMKKNTIAKRKPTVFATVLWDSLANAVI